MIQVLLIVVILVLLLEAAYAFRAMPMQSFRDSGSATSTTPYVEKNKKNKSSSSISWSLQMPDVPLPISSWYNVVSNPTARRITYDDGPCEFQFSAVGSSWPDMVSGQQQRRLGLGGDYDIGDDADNDDVQSGMSHRSSNLSSSRRQRGGPLRRAGKWIRRRF